MDLGIAGKWGGYYLSEQYRKSTAGTNGGVGFAQLAAAKAAGQPDVSGISFKDMWQTRFSGAYYHVMDGYKISQGTWERLDFPHDDFFRNKVDESILDWKPTGPEPKMTDSSVQSRAVSTLGKKSIVVPPALEEKMKNDPNLAKQVMERVETFIAEKEAAKRPNRICSYILVLDEEGEIARTCITSGGGVSGPTEAAQRQFEAEQEAKRKRRAEYMGIVEESALKRKLMEQEANEQYDKASIAKEKVSAVYEKNSIETVAEKSAQDKVAECGEKDEEQIRRMSETDFEERVLQSAGPNAPQSVKDAWMETVKEVGVNGLGETKNGRTHITDMHIQQIIAHYYGLSNSTDILGNSVESAMRATQKALYDFDHPLEPNRVISIEEQQALVKERQFYVSFLEKLEKLLTGNKEQNGTDLYGAINRGLLRSK